MIKAVFFDIDGTLISFETHRVPQSAREAIKILRERGIKVFIATGRSAHQFTNLEGIHFDGYITLNGGYCMTDKNELIYKNVIPREDIEALVEYQKENPFPCTFTSATDLFINYYDDAVEKVLSMIDVPRYPIKDIREALTQEIFQLSAFISLERAQPVMSDVLVHCNATTWNPIFLDIMAKGSSKQDGIDRILEYYGLDLSESMCFGDGGNDVSMLQHTPVSVAMGNAADEVKQHATYVTSSVDEDGIWNALKHFELI